MVRLVFIRYMELLFMLNLCFFFLCEGPSRYIRIITIKEKRNFLQSRALCLDEEQPYTDYFYHQDYNVDKVKLPCQLLQPDGVYVLIDYSGQSRDAEAEGQAFRSEAVRQDLR